MFPSESVVESLVIRGDEWGSTARSRDPSKAATEIALADYFQSGRVVFHAYDTSYVPTMELQEWAAQWEAPFFDTTSSLKEFLRNHHG